MISHKHKCIFIHIPKTAGSSINSFFHPGAKFHHDSPDYEILFGWCPERKLHMQHATSKQLLETGLVTEEQWSTYYKFTFTRNSWDRAYSDYLFIQKFSGVQGSFKSFLKKENEFESILNDSSTSSYLGDHLQLQTDFFDFEGIYKPDFIGRFEYFSEDIQTVLNQLHIEETFNKHSNKSKRVKDYSLFYTNSNKRLVRNKYLKDIEALNYTFDDKRKGLHLLKKLQ